MALAPLATSADLSVRGVDVSNTQLVDQMLAAASEAVRDAAGSPISQHTSTVTVEAGPGRSLRLPAQPVTAVSAVSIDGSAVTDWRLVSGALWRVCGWQDGREPALVTVTFTHGLLDVPADIVALVCDFAIAGMNTATDGAKSGITGRSTSLDDYSEAVQYAQNVDSMASVMEVPERTGRMLRARFGGGIYVTSEAT